MPIPDKPIYFIQEHFHREVFHGGISNVDIEKIFIRRNYRAIQMPCRESFSILSKMRRLIYLLKIFFTLPAGSRVLFQFPLYARLDSKLISLLAKRKKITPVCFIADIDGLRDNDPELLRYEIRFLKRFTYFLVHNDSMEKWLQEFIPSCVTAKLEIFDFLVGAIPPLLARTKGFHIDFAGDLSKSPFYKKLSGLPASSASLKFYVYGSADEAVDTNPEQVVISGRVVPAEIPARLQGNFGLVWDGDGIDTCSGGYGDYLRYNSPHKLSLYIVSRLPVIIWREAATAAFVLEHHIGFAVDRLSDIEQRIAELSGDEYRIMLENMGSLAEKVSSGYFTERALDEVLGRICP